MDTISDDEREIRAARNQALFRSVNERIRGMNKAISEFTGTFAISCECADTNCIEQLEIAPEEYEAVRAEPRRFVVLPGHIYPDVEQVVRETAAYVVVEKLQKAGELAEELAGG
jgi:5-bromo-4-chloroindolyl phosphate hydrolysis protein